MLDKADKGVFMDKNGKKNFDGWIKIKKKLHYNGKNRVIKEGEIWWCAIGENIGSEICGKGETFVRPILVLKKLSKHKYSKIGEVLNSDLISVRNGLIKLIQKNIP